MSTLTKEIRLIYTDVVSNNNKFWYGYLYDDGRVESKYGRVGVTEQVTDYGVKGETFLLKKKAEKLKKGYTEARVVAPTIISTPAKNVGSRDLVSIALSQIKYSNKTLEGLIRRLAQSNVHKITSSTNITYNEREGVFATPLGVVTLDAIAEARDLLAWFVKDNAVRKVNADFKDKLNMYLRLIPQKTSWKIDPAAILPDMQAVQKHSDVLDALENSYSLVTSTPTADCKTPTPKAQVEQVFKLKLDRLEDAKARQRLIDWFQKTNKSMHGYTRTSPAEIYEVDIEDYNAAFEEKIGNLQEVWHGSGQSNILSILKNGLRCSPPSTAAIAGKMFGNGVYGSQTASKSLGYTYGKWGQGSGGDAGWLFVCDFAMGNAYYPTHATSNIPAGHDSCWAVPGKTSLLNDELIVYREKQIRIKYLLEIK